MFIRKKANKSGTVSVQVVQKTKTRTQRVVKSFGAASPDDTAALEKLMQSASSFLQEMEGPALPHMYEEEDVIDDFIGSLSNTQVQVVAWYDNENSYTSQMVRTIKYFSELK